jgi:hypothetical protein
VSGNLPTIDGWHELDGRLVGLVISTAHYPQRLEAEVDRVAGR